MFTYNKRIFPNNVGNNILFSKQFMNVLTGSQTVFITVGSKRIQLIGFTTTTTFDHNERNYMDVPMT